MIRTKTSEPVDVPPSTGWTQLFRLPSPHLGFYYSLFRLTVDFSSIVVGNIQFRIVSGGRTLFSHDTQSSTGGGVSLEIPVQDDVDIQVRHDQAGTQPIAGTLTYSINKGW